MPNNTTTILFTTTTGTSTITSTATSSASSSPSPTLNPKVRDSIDVNIIIGLAAATAFLFLIVLVCAIYGFIRHYQKVMKKDAARAHASINTSIPLSNPPFPPAPAAGGKGSVSDDDEITTAPNPVPPNFAAAPTVNSPPKKHSKLKSIELVEGYRDSELASAIAGLQGKNLRPVSVDEAVSRAGPMQPSRFRAVDLHTVPDIEEIVVPMETLAWRFRRGPTGVWTTELGTSWWDERPVGVGWDGRWRVPAEVKDNRVDPSEPREDHQRNRGLSDSTVVASSGGAMRSYGHPVRRVNTYQSIGSSVTRSNMVSAQVKRLFTWKRYYDFRAGGVGGYDAGLSGAICALEASDRREQFATFLDMLEETLMALSVLEDTEGDDGVDEVYSNYNHNMAHGGRMSPSSNASTMVARSVADSIARKLAAKTTQDAVEAVGLVQALGAVLVDMSIEAPSFKVNVGYMPSTYNEIPLEKNDLVTLFGLIDDRVGYGLNRRTNELGFVPLAHIDQHTVYQRPPDSYRPNPKRLSSRQLGLRQPGHSLNTNVIQRMAIANPNGHFRQGSTTNVGRQDVPAPPTDEQLLEVLRTAGQAGSAGSGGSSGDGGVPNATRKASVNSSINAGIADGKRYSIGQTIHVPAGYAPSAQRAGVQAAYGRAASPYTGHQQPAVGQSREERQYRRAGMASPIPGDYGRLPPNPNHPKFSDQGTPTYYHPGQTKGRIENDGRQEGRYAEGMYEEPLSEVSGVADAGRKHSAGGRVHAASPVPHQFGAPPVHGGYASPVPHRYGREERDPRYGGFGVPQNRARSKSNVGGYPDPNVPVHKHQRSQSTGSILSAESEGPYELPPERPEMPQRVVQHGQYPPPPQGRPGVGVKHMQHRLPYSRVGQLSPIPASPSTPTSPIGSTPSSHTSPGAGPSESIPPIPGQQPIRYNLESLGPIARPCQIPMQTLSPTGPVPPPPTRTSPTSLTSSSPPRSAKSPIFSTSSKSNTGTPATPATPRTLDYDEDGEEDVDEEEVGSVKSPALSAVLPQRVPAGRDEGSGKAYELGPAGLRHSRPDSDEVVIIEDGSRWSAESDRPEIKGKRGSDDVEVR